VVYSLGGGSPKPLQVGVPMTHEELEKEVERLKIKFETLLNHLETNPIGLGSHKGRSTYDKLVVQALAQKGLQE
jgi:hypothetical protein